MTLRELCVTSQLAASLGASTYPYVALLAFSGARLRLIAAVEGPLPPGELAATLASAAEEHGAELVAEQAEASERVRPYRAQSANQNPHEAEACGSILAQLANLPYGGR